MENNIVVLGEDPDSGQIIAYEASSAEFDLASIAAVLVPILISAGLKALLEFITKGEFAIKYPGGKLKFLYNLAKDKTSKPNISRHVLNLIMDNEMNVN